MIRYFYTEFRSQASSKDYFLIKKKNIYIKKLPANRFAFFIFAAFLSKFNGRAFIDLRN